ncbi:MAG: hypothetical protein CMJ19_22840 [Phycisphaeraceae bacterium]|nr:hypothetical protein [Phycisphaeraceae bacterium]
MLCLYQETLSVRNYQPASLKKNLQHARRFLEWTDPNNPSEITPAKVEDYFIHLQANGSSPKTIKNHRSSVKVFCDFLCNRGMLKDNPVRHVPSRELPEEVPVFLPDNEVQQVYRIAAEQGITAEVTLALNTGLRMEEMRRLKWADIDLEQRQILVRKSKGKRPRTVPINERLMKCLLMQRELYGHLVYVFPGGTGKRGNRNKWTLPRMRGLDWWARTAFKKIQEEIPTLRDMPKGRTGRGWHSLRHTFATRVARAQIDIFKLKDWLGHKKVETTLRYVHLARQYDADIELI